MSIGSLIICLSLYNAILAIKSGLIFSIAGIITFFVSFSKSQKPGYSCGFFINPNTNAFYASFFIPITLYYILFKKDTFHSNSIRIKYIFGLIIMLINLFLTFSRAGYVGIAISFAIIIYFYSKKKFVAFIILGIILIQQSIPFLTMKGGSTIARLGLLYAAIELLKSSHSGFLWGFGTMSVFEKYADYKDFLGISFDPVNYPHNFVIFYIMQFGIISIIPLIIFFINFFYKSFKYILKKAKNDVTILFFTITISILIQSLFEDTILVPQFFVYPLFLIFFGMLRKEINSEPELSKKINTSLI